MEDPSLAAKIDTWTREAFSKWGADWSRISKHIERRMATLDPAEKHHIALEAALTLVHTAEVAKH
jgi:hypothetical protein